MSKFPDRKIQRERSKQAKWAQQNKGGFVGKKTFDYTDMTPHNAWKLSQKDVDAEDIRYK